MIDRDAGFRDSIALAPLSAGIFGRRFPIFADRRISLAIASSRRETIMARERNLGARREFRISQRPMVIAPDSPQTERRRRIASQEKPRIRSDEAAMGAIDRTARIREAIGIAPFGEWVCGEFPD